jgi:hypothetical protein
LPRRIALQQNYGTRETSNISAMNDDQSIEKWQRLFQSIEDVLVRPEIAALLSAEATAQLVQIRDFARSWEEHALHLSDEQRARCFSQLADAVSALTATVAEFDQIRLRSMPVEHMGKA